jgi:proline iminopeptidase
MLYSISMTLLRSTLLPLCFALFSATAFAATVDGLYAAAYGQPTNPSILFLHGGPGYNSFSFEFSNAEALAARGYYVVVFDQRGCGRSERAPESDFTFANAVKDVRSVVNYFHLKNPFIIGHSYGGTLAIKYAQTYPNDFRSILLADAPMNQPAMVANILDRCERFYADNSDSSDLELITQMREYVFGSGTYHIDPEYGGYVFLHALQCGLYIPRHPGPQRARLLQQLARNPKASLQGDSQGVPFASLIKNEGWLTKNLLPEASAIKNKIAVIVGADDGLFGDDQRTEFQTVFGDKALVVPNASHNIFVDQQDVFLNFVEKTFR